MNVKWVATTADAGFHVVPMQVVAPPFTLPRAQIKEAKAANDESPLPSTTNWAKRAAGVLQSSGAEQTRSR